MQRQHSKIWSGTGSRTSGHFGSEDIRRSARARNFRGYQGNSVAHPERRSVRSSDSFENGVESGTTASCNLSFVGSEQAPLEVRVAIEIIEISCGCCGPPALQLRDGSF